jgi:hypothetical protein
VPVAIVLAAAGATVWNGARGTASTGPGTIRIVDVQRSDTKLGAGVGAREIVHADLYRRGVDKLLGAEVLLCTYVGADERLCSATYTLPKGTIVATGTVQSRLLYELAIVGGTDLYDNARGTLTVTTYRLRPRRDVLLFRLTG